MHSDDADASDPPTEDQLRRVYGHRSMAARAMPVAMQPADPALVLQLQEMGFPEEMVRKETAVQEHCAASPRLSTS